jgi:hypothetical protein
MFPPSLLGGLDGDKDHSSTLEDILLHPLPLTREQKQRLSGYGLFHEERTCDVCEFLCYNTQLLSKHKKKMHRK